MATTHTVQQGESVSAIAQKYGFPNWKALYDHPDNQSFKALRPDPSLIFPGDKIAIPEIKKAIFKAKLNKKQAFRSQIKKETISLKVGAIGGKLWCDRKVELEVDGDTIESKTDAEGVAQFKLPKNHSNNAILSIYTPKETTIPSYRVEVKLGHLDPIEEIIGQKARLIALGYDCGSLTNTTTNLFEETIKAFQLNFDLKVDGICGPQTQKQLKQEYGC